MQQADDPLFFDDVSATPEFPITYSIEISEDDLGVAADLDPADFEISADNPLDLTQHYGMVVKVSLMFWRKLPPRFKVMYSPEDMINLGHVTVLQKFKQFEPRHRAKFCSWMTGCLKNAFKDVLAGAYATKRKANESSIDGSYKQPSFEIGDMLIVAEAWRNIRQSASPELGSFLDAIFDPSKPLRKPPDSIVEELRELIKFHNFTFADMRAILRGPGLLPSQLAVVKC